MEAPWTRDGTVRADVVKVAPDVSGLVSEVLVRDNQDVRKGQVLFRIDPLRFQYALDQATANVTAKESAAQEAAREMNRYRQLTSLEVSTEEQQQSNASMGINTLRARRIPARYLSLKPSEGKENVFASLLSVSTTAAAAAADARSP